ncbi:CIA30 family protein [Pontimicrobium sp. SW4]|uniref:CIA30 family protein n=1 Tax=Pontimicrobium sp. SW4 TaxID=3153519 RepID=A0AAU7BWE7_9FLAO
MKINVLMVLLILLNQDTSSNIIFDYKDSKTLKNWFILDDRVMGGLSRGNVKMSKTGNIIYYGDVTTENNGGFSSLRYQFKPKDVSAFNKIAIRVKGDGIPYQFRIKSDKRQRYSYVSNFETTGDWETIIIPFKKFIPQFRGNKVNAPNYKGEKMEEIAFLIGNKTNESFQLNIASIMLIK